MPTGLKKQADGSWRERQRLELGALIYQTALELFRTNGFETATVQQIASAVGIGKGTFFNHFPSKDHVLQEWYREVTRNALAEMSIVRFASGRDAVLALTQKLASDVAEDPFLWDAKTGATSSALLRHEEDTLDQEVVSFCRSEIERDIRSGHLAASTDARFLTDMVLTVLTGTAHSWSVSGHRWDLADTLADRIAFVLDAARQPKGHQQ